MVLTRKQKISFYRNKSKIREVIIMQVKKRKHIIFGARSLNAHFPKFLDKPTVDYDILVEERNPKKVATRLEKKLDKKFKGNFFIVEKAKHGGTYKVKRILGKEGIIDISKAEGKVPTDKIRGVRYSKLSFEKEKIKQSLADPQSKFRHDKDRERLERIRIFESLKKKKFRRKITINRNIIKTFPIRFKLKTRPNF